MNENKKDFNTMLNNSKDMPKIKVLDNVEVIKRYGGTHMLLAPPIDYDNEMKLVPKGKLTTSELIRSRLSKKYGGDFTCPLTAGIFINIVAWASFQRSENITPYWRTLKKDGELNEKFPGGVMAQQEKLENEGFIIISRGKNKLRYFVQDYEKYLV